METQTKTETSFSWVRQIPGDLFKLDEKPLLGFPPPFPWSDFASKLGDLLEIKEIDIQQGAWEWMPKENLFTGLGGKLRGLPLAVTPIPGKIWWVMPEQDLTRLANTLLTKQEMIPIEDIEPEFLSAFYRFCAIEVINTLEKVDFDKKLSPNMSAEEGLPEESCLALDITLTLHQETLHGRLFLSQEFRRGWKQRYLQEQNHLMMQSPLADSLDVQVHLEAGRVKIDMSEWKRVNPGDMILLDSCSLDPDEDKGRVMLTINGIPYFRAKLKQGSIKILEHPLYYEANTTMSTPPKNKNTHDEDDDMEGLDFEDESSLGEDEDFDITDDDLLTDEHSEAEHTESEYTESEYTEEEEEEEDLKDFKEEKAEKKALPKRTSQKQEEDDEPEETSVTGLEKSESPPTSIEDIPLTLIVEVGRIQMSIKKLLELQPGNMLDLDIHPEAGVDMVVNGKRVARGELLRIGDALGVRIIDLS